MNLKCKTINIKMREKSVIIALFLLIGGALVGLTLWSNHGGQDDMWRLDDVYSSQHSTMSRASSVFTNSSASSDMTNGGVALSMSRSSLKSSRAHVPCYSYAPTMPATSSSSLMSNGASPAGGGLYTTSSAAMRSFGDGSSSSMGSSRSSAGAGAAAAAGGVYTSMPSAVSSSSWGGGGSSSSSGAYASSFVMSSAQSANPANAIAMGSSAGSNSLYSGFAYTSMLDQYQMASYGNSGANRISGRQNVGGPGDNAYADWLRWMYTYGQGYHGEIKDGVYVYYEEDAEEAWRAWFLYQYGCEPENYTGSAPMVDFNTWLEWFKSLTMHEYNDGKNSWFFRFPLGDSWSLLVMVLLYTCFMVLRRCRKQIVIQSRNN